MSTYLFAVQDTSGRELLSVTREAKKVSEVKVTREDGGRVVSLRHDGQVIAQAQQGDPYPDELFLHRWPADDKLAEPVTHRVK